MTRARRVARVASGGATAAALAVGIVGLVGGTLWWRGASRRRPLPCPPWMAWLLSNRYTNTLAGAATVLEPLGLAPGMRVLDAGCGPGRLTIPAAERVGPRGEVIALDAQVAMLARVRSAAAQRGLANIRTLHGSVESAALAPGSVDRAFLVAVLGEVPDRVRALCALHAALRPDGVLSVTELLPDPHYQTRRTVRGLAERAGFELAGQHGTWLAFTMRFRKRATPRGPVGPPDIDRPRLRRRL